MSGTAEVDLTWERSRDAGTDSQVETILVNLGVDDDFLTCVAEAIYDIVDAVHVTVRFDDGSTHRGTFSVDAGRHGEGRWEVLLPDGDA